MLSRKRVRVKWPQPFSIAVLGYSVSLLETPPRPVEEILKAHARREADRKLIEKVIAAAGLAPEDASAARSLYTEGIDWQLIRQMLTNKRCNIAQEERDALHSLVVGKFWPAKRLLLEGLLGHGACNACLEAIADHKHAPS